MRDKGAHSSRNQGVHGVAMTSQNARMWHQMNLGRGRQGYMPTEQIQLAFARAFKAAGRPCDMAVFIHSSIDSPEVKLYFSPAVASLAARFDATPCAQPSTQGLHLLVGDQSAWDFVFDVDAAQVRMPSRRIRHARAPGVSASP